MQAGLAPKINAKPSLLVSYRPLVIGSAGTSCDCAYQISRSKMLRIAAVLVAGASALQAPRLSSAPAWLNAATLEQPPAASKDLLPRERYVSPGA
jgi:hypothetical protein